MTAIHKCRESCEGCPYGGPKVGAKGPEDSQLVVAAESPGKVEVRKGYPLAGPSGEIVHMYIKPEEAFFVNAMECSPRPKKKGQDMNIKAARCCHDRFIEDVSQYPRKLIVAMGAAAVQSLTGDYDLKITKIRGQLLQSPYAELGVLPMLHPAALMRGTGSFRQWQEDVAYGLDLLHGRDVKRFIPPTTYDIPYALDNETQFQTAFASLCQYPYLSADIETAALRFKDPEAYIIDIGIEGLNEKQEPSGTVYRFDPKWVEHREEFRNLLESREHRWIWHNGKFDVQFIHEMYGIDARTDEDTMLLSYARDEMGGVHDMDTVGTDVLNAPNHKGMLDQYLPNKKTSYAVIPQHVRTEYLGLDVAKTSQIFQTLRPRIADDPALEKLYTHTLIPASEMLMHVERRGIFVDQEVVKANEEYFQQELEESLSTIHELAGKPVNPNSPPQMQKLLFEDFKLPNKAKGSTAAEVLEKLPQLPIVKALQGHRKLQKLYGTYVKNLWGHLGSDNRVHPTYLIHGTRTGRLSSREPNMQNQPRDKRVRGQFSCAPGYRLLEIDLSQAELRVLACLSGDEALINVFSSKRDPHTEVAREMFNLPEDVEPTKEQRVVAKTINFGIIYGKTAHSIALDFGITVEQGAEYLRKWFERFPKAEQFIKRCRDCPRKLQTITTCFGRKKRPGLVTKDILRDLQNEAANFPEQSIASDITLHAAIRTFRWLEERGAYIVNLVHDALIIEVPDNAELIDEVVNKVRGEMEKVPEDWGLTGVPFLSDAEIGTHWGYLEDYYVEEAA